MSGPHLKASFTTVLMAINVKCHLVCTACARCAHGVRMAGACRAHARACHACVHNDIVSWHAHNRIDSNHNAIVPPCTPPPRRVHGVRMACAWRAHGVRMACASECVRLARAWRAHGMRMIESGMACAPKLNSQATGCSNNDCTHVRRLWSELRQPRPRQRRLGAVERARHGCRLGSIHKELIYMFNFFILYSETLSRVH